MLSSDSFYNYILLDDEEIICSLWAISAKQQEISFLAFQTFDELLKSTHLFHFEKTAFFIDYFLGDGELTGACVGKILFERGYKNIFLSTGNIQVQLEKIHYIKGIVPKIPPWSLT